MLPCEYGAMCALSRNASSEAPLALISTNASFRLGADWRMLLISVPVSTCPASYTSSICTLRRAFGFVETTLTASPEGLPCAIGASERHAQGRAAAVERSAGFVPWGADLVACVAVLEVGGFLDLLVLQELDGGVEVDVV